MKVPIIKEKWRKINAFKFSNLIIKKKIKKFKKGFF